MTLILIQIIGSVSLLLWGTRMIRLGFTRAYATSLQRIIAVNTSNRIKAFFAGIGVTAILQSSTATAMICTSFASKNMISTAAGLAVIIGADVGTTLVAQVLIFDLSWLMPMFLFVGVFLHHRYEHKGRRKHIARAFIGMGLVLLALATIKASAAPLASSETLPYILKPLEQEPLLALLVAAGLTWLLHSSLASILIIASFVSNGIISPELALLLVLGTNLGGAITPYVITLKMTEKARRITTGNLIMRVCCVLIFLPSVGLFYELLNMSEGDAGRKLMHFHMIFNLCLAIMFLPFVRQLSVFCKQLLPTKVVEKKSEERPAYLDESALESPTIALAAAARETLRVARIVEEMFTDSMTALKNEDVKLLKHIIESDSRVDMLHGEIKHYLTRVTEEALDPRESDRFVQILSFSTNLEHVGDIIENSIVELVRTKIETKNRFSAEGFNEIKDFHHKILNNMKIAQAIFMSEDSKLAQQLVEGKKIVRKAAEESTEKHFQRFREGVPETVSTSALHTDIIRDYKRINSYITTVAYSILDVADRHKSARHH